jgi:hypothetical protein
VATIRVESLASECRATKPKSTGTPTTLAAVGLRAWRPVDDLRSAAVCARGGRLLAGGADSEPRRVDLECELLDRSTLRSQAEARAAICPWIEGW